MLKGLGMLIGGIFVGAVGIEVVHKKCPKVFSKLYGQTREAVSQATEAFRAGYDNAARPKPGVKPSA